jgi:hypothetical protein
VSDPPPFPYAQLAFWLTATTDTVAVVALWLSDIPLIVKYLTTSGLALGSCAIIAFYLGKRSR